MHNKFFYQTSFLPAVALLCLIGCAARPPAQTLPITQPSPSAHIEALQKSAYALRLQYNEMGEQLSFLQNQIDMLAHHHMDILLEENKPLPTSVTMTHTITDNAGKKEDSHVPAMPAEALRETILSEETKIIPSPKKSNKSKSNQLANPHHSTEAPAPIKASTTAPTTLIAALNQDDLALEPAHQDNGAVTPPLPSPIHENPIHEKPAHEIREEQTFSEHVAPETDDPQSPMAESASAETDESALPETTTEADNAEQPQTLTMNEAQNEMPAEVHVETQLEPPATEQSAAPPTAKTHDATATPHEASAAAPRPSMVYLVHLASYHARNEVTQGWTKLKSMYPALLRNRSAVMTSFRDDKNQSWLRLSVGPLNTKDEAHHLCALMMDQQIWCDVLSTHPTYLRPLQ